MNIWDQLVDCICRPPRDQYNPNDLLGGTNQTFMVGNMEATRIDFELTNKQGLTMKCSHYLPLDAKTKDGTLPAVVYCHCNSGSRRDAEEAVWHLLPCGVGVVAFDFTGSGLSDGKWVTLGALEVDDLAVVIQHLRSMGGISSIGLWGRSMGAVTALLYSSRDPDIAGMVLDSPFSRLTDLMLEIVVSQRLPIPKVMLRLALKLMRSSVKRKAGCDICAVSALDVVGKSLIPAMFGHGEDDSFINVQHSVKLHKAYNSTADYPVYKNLVRFKGDHNHPRPAFFYSSVCCFFHQQLKLDTVLLGATPTDTQRLLTQGSLNLSGEPPDQVDRANGFVNAPWSLDGIPYVDLPPEEQQAAAAAAAAALVPYGADPAAAAAPAAGSDVQNLLLSSEAGALNSPKAARSTNSRRGIDLLGSAAASAPAGRFDDIMQQRQWHAASSNSGSRPVGIAGSSSSNRHSSQQRSAAMQDDAFEVGSRGNNVALLDAVGCIPSPIAAEAPLGLKSSCNGSAAAVGSSSSGKTSYRRSTASSVPVPPAAGSSGVKGNGLSGATGFMAAGSQSLKRLLLGRSAGSSNLNPAAGKQVAAAATSGAVDYSRRSIDNSALPLPNDAEVDLQGLQQAGAGEQLWQHDSYGQQQQHQRRHALQPATRPSAAAAAAVSPLAAGATAVLDPTGIGLKLPTLDALNGPISSSSHQQQLPTQQDLIQHAAPQIAASSHSSSQQDRSPSTQGIHDLLGFGVQDNTGAWVGVSIEDAEAAMDPDLAAAIAASLQDQQQLMGAVGPAAAAAGGGNSGSVISASDAEALGLTLSQGGVQQQQQQQQRKQQQHQTSLGLSRAPVTAEEEEEMLRRAIELSLAEGQQQEQLQQEQLQQEPTHVV